MALLIGIDEAGYGPLLGPLVVSSVVFELPEEHLRSDLWKLLKPAVAGTKQRLSGRLLVTDSKKAYTPAAGVGHLRRTVLACLHALQAAPSSPRTAHDLLDCLDNAAAQRIAAYKWYNKLGDQPLGHDRADVDLASSVLGKSLLAKQIKLLSIQSRCLDVIYFNAKVQQVRNKSRVLFTELCTLILSALRDYCRFDQPVHVIVDRQGGRINYHQELLRMFPGVSLSVIRQDEKMSCYDLQYGPKSIRIHFCIKADLKYFPVCLASMTSKYLREVLMEAQNAYFCDLCPELKPTAGYWEDGRRFLDELALKLPDYRFEKDELIRTL
ncbi:MAG: hypothetical protein LLF76_07640 [Planctomycetaceae bacterium]|nr:hypothetical protein [Planctomycetaceae bacterium]